MAFSCGYLRKISVDVPSQSAQTTDKKISIAKEQFQAVLDVFDNWITNYRFAKRECPGYNRIGLENRHPEFCSEYRVYYQTHGLFTATSDFYIYVFYDEKIGKPIIQFFEYSGSVQSKKSEQMEKELSGLLMERFGKGAIQVVIK